MSVDVSSSIVIDRPVERVASFATDPDNVPAWYANIKSVEWRTPRPLQRGSRIAFVAHFFGRRLEYVYEVAEWIPNRRLVMRTADGPFPMETTYTWEAAGRGTRMTLRNRGRPAGFSTWVAPLLAFGVRRANRKDLARLKARLEGADVE